MKKYLIVILCTILFTACSDKTLNLGGSLHTATIGKQYIKSEYYKYSRTEFNKKCYSEAIPSELSKWYTASYKDYETKKEVKGYVYIKQNDKEVLPVTYRLSTKVEKDSLFLLEIRKIKSVE